MELREKVLNYLKSGGSIYYSYCTGYYHSCQDFGWGEIWQVCEDLRAEKVIKRKLIGDGSGVDWSVVQLKEAS